VEKQRDTAIMSRNVLQKKFPIPQHELHPIRLFVLLQDALATETVPVFHRNWPSEVLPRFSFLSLGPASFLTTYYNPEIEQKETTTTQETRTTLYNGILKYPAMAGAIIPSGRATED
jgi:hypothetical protein